jgi:hypothetical protein
MAESDCSLLSAGSRLAKYISPRLIMGQSIAFSSGELWCDCRILRLNGWVGRHFRHGSTDCPALATGDRPLQSHCYQPIHISRKPGGLAALTSSTVELNRWTFTHMITQRNRHAPLLRRANIVTWPAAAS